MSILFFKLLRRILLLATAVTLYGAYVSKGYAMDATIPMKQEQELSKEEIAKRADIFLEALIKACQLEKNL